MAMKRSTTTKDVALLLQLYEQGQLILDSEFQRNSVWPRTAKAYLIDTIINDRPIPIFFMQRTVSPDDGRSLYAVIDGQQRLRAVFEFIQGKFRLTESDEDAAYYRKTYGELSARYRDRILSYIVTVEELSGYNVDAIRDIFIRMNKYVVRLSPQELRHAASEGKFRDFVESMGQWKFWTHHRVFSPAQIARMRAVEFSAELTVLILEGPQDKKLAVDLYYGQYRSRFPGKLEIRKTLIERLEWINKALPNLGSTRYRKPVDLYGLVGALERIVNDRKALPELNSARKRLLAFEELVSSKEANVGLPARYRLAASQQTDNIAPRVTRIEILSHVLMGGKE